MLRVLHPPSHDTTTTSTSRTTTIGGGENMSINEALQRVAVWRIRASRRLPHAIESTYALASLLYQDTTWTPSPHDTTTTTTTVISSCSLHLSLGYASAIVRTLNGLVDGLQQSRTTAASVTHLSSLLGIPSWLVHIRHQVTHNQLESLSVLQTAAQTLLQYLQNNYWQPLQDEWYQQQDKIQQVLHDYDTCSLQTIATQSSQQAPSLVAPEDTNNDDDDDQSSSTSSTSSRELERGLRERRRIGSSLNSFALLGQSKVKVKPNKPTETKKRTNLAKKIKTTKGSLSSSCTACAKKLTRLAIPMDVIHDVLLQHLVGTNDKIEGVLIPPLSIPASQQGFATIQQQYKPLLLACGRVWPGFVPRLWVHLIDALISTELSQTALSLDKSLRRTNSRLQDNMALQRCIFFLATWARALISPEFVGQWEGSPNRKVLADDSQILVTTLQRLGYPLHSVVDKCLEHATATKGSRKSLQLGESLQGLLGQEYVPHFGLRKPTRDTTVSSLEPPPMASSPEESTLTNDMTLEAMERLLADTEHPSEEPSMPREESDSTNLDRETENNLAWHRCKTWDACAIGTLPGEPGREIKFY